MSALQPLFGKYVTETATDLVLSATISRPFVGWYRRLAAHEQSRAALLRALGRAFPLRLIWDEVDGLGLDPTSWVPVAPKTRSVPGEISSKSMLPLLEPGGWLLYGSTSNQLSLERVHCTCDEAMAAGAEIALSASFDSDQWELCARPAAMALLERQLNME